MNVRAVRRYLPPQLRRSNLTCCQGQRRAFPVDWSVECQLPIAIQDLRKAGDRLRCGGAVMYISRVVSQHLTASPTCWTSRVSP